MGPNHFLKINIKIQLIINATGAKENILSNQIKFSKKDLKSIENLCDIHTH
jgi:hypothetical protein